MKQQYQKPVAAISIFSTEDVITTSGVVTGGLDEVNFNGSTAWKTEWNQQ